MKFNPYQQINQTHGHIFHRSVNSTNSVEVELTVKNYHLSVIFYQKWKSIWMNFSSIKWNIRIFVVLWIILQESYQILAEMKLKRLYHNNRPISFVHLWQLLLLKNSCKNNTNFWCDIQAKHKTKSR